MSGDYVAEHREGSESAGGKMCRSTAPGTQDSYTAARGAQGMSAEFPEALRRQLAGLTHPQCYTAVRGGWVRSRNKSKVPEETQRTRSSQANDGRVIPLGIHRSDARTSQDNNSIRARPSYPSALPSFVSV